MPNSKQIVYLSQAQYQELITNGTITVNGVTVTYDENDIYVTPQAEPVTDVRVAGTSVAANGVADIPKATSSSFGVTKSGVGLVTNSSGEIYLNTPTENNVKAGTEAWKALVPQKQHLAAFYGLAKVAGHDEASSTEPLGTYTPEAKGAIQSMLGVSDLIAPAENDLVASKAYKVGDVFTANGKLYKVTAAIAADEAIVLQNEGEEIAGANAVESSVGEGFPHDVQINGVSVVNEGIANIPLVVNRGTSGIVKVNQSLGITEALGTLTLSEPNLATIKPGVNGYYAISPKHQHEAAFYGLAKAAGDTTQSQSDNAVGTYTDAAKTAIRTMIGATSPNVIAVQDETPTDADTKIWLPETAETPVEVPTVAEMNAALAGKVDDVQVNSVSVVSNGVANIPFANANNNGGIFRFRANRGLIMSADGYMATNVTDVQINGTAIIDGSGVANIPIATQTTFGVTKGYGSAGINIDASGNVSLAVADASKVKAGTSNGSAIPPSMQHTATFYGLAKASGDTTQSASSNAVGTYTDNAKASIKAMLGIQDGSTGTVDVTGTTPTIAAVENTRYVCGEVTSLNFTPAASGICIVRFTSGSTVTVLTLPSTVKFPEWFDPTSLETNTIYEICITDGVYGAVMSWAQ